MSSNWYKIRNNSFIYKSLKLQIHSIKKNNQIQITNNHEYYRNNQILREGAVSLCMNLASLKNLESLDFNIG